VEETFGVDILHPVDLQQTMHFRPTYSYDSDTEKALRFALAIDIQVDKGNLAPSWTAKKNAKQF
jgi:hypothetical protein